MKQQKKTDWSWLYRPCVFFVFISVFVSLTAEVWSNSEPLVMKYKGELYFPVFQNYHPLDLGIHDSLDIDYKHLSLGPGGWAFWPLNPWGPYEINPNVSYYPAPPSMQNWLGTDDRGRDILARLIYGFRYSLAYSVSVWLVTSLLGVILGNLSGFFGGWFDLSFQRVIEVLSSLPHLFLLIFLISMFEPSLTLLTLVSSVLGWMGISLYVRAEALKARSFDFVEAARAAGAGWWRLSLRHILPHTLTPVVTFAPFAIVGGIGGLAILSFLGFGLAPPTPSWGELLRQGKEYMATAWWLALFPAAALFFVLLNLTLVGEVVRVHLDPQAKAHEQEDVKETLFGKLWAGWGQRKRRGIGWRQRRWEPLSRGAKPVSLREHRQGQGVS